MNKIISFQFLALIFMFWACSTPPGEATAESKAEVVAETEAPADLFTVTVLNDSIPSPRKELTATVAGVDLTINYGSPSVKGRTVWGELVPYADVWRAGANEATTISVSKDIEISGQKLPAGTYGFFTIPGESDWTLIFNETAKQWGAYEYDESKDVMRVKVIPQEAAEMSETMEFKVMEGNTVALVWDKLVVPFVVAGE